MDLLSYWTWSSWNWLVLAVIIAILELFIPGILFLWFGLSAACVGLLLLVFPDMGWHYQLVLFAVLGGVSAIAARFILRKKETGTDDLALNRRGQQYIGRTAVLESSIQSGRGRIRLDDTTWLVTGPDATAGTSVKIVGVEGALLRIQPLNMPHTPSANL